MVKLDRIYTRGGDDGQTSLIDGSRISKDALRIHAMGEVDEANGVIGLARHELETAGSDLAPILARTQNDLFDLGADLAAPGSDAEDGNLRIRKSQIDRLEREIDSINETLEPITSFILPGGSGAATWLHLARTVVRRAERAAVALAREEPANQQASVYLNRLSDLVFVMARAANDGGRQDVLWQPGLTAVADDAANPGPG